MQFTSTWTLNDLHRDIIIPAHVQNNHFVLYIISYAKGIIYILDSLYRRNYKLLTQNIIHWYTKLYEKNALLACTAVNMPQWQIIAESKLPATLPYQTDSTSCGVFAAMHSYYYVKLNRLPDSRLDWNESHIPFLRLFMADQIYPTYCDTEALQETVVDIIESKKNHVRILIQQSI